MTTDPLRARVEQLTDAARITLAQRLGLFATNAVASADPRDTGTLVAYYVSTSGADLSVDALRAHAKQSLPPHAVPSIFRRIDTIPRTRHGKVDAAALPDPFDIAPAAPPIRADTLLEHEAELLAIWSRVLGTARVGRDDSFFELGGDSLLAIRLLGQIRDRWQMDLTLADIFDRPTVAGIAALIGTVQWARETSPPDESTDEVQMEDLEF
jgi:acyl carrier protein